MSETATAVLIVDDDKPTREVMARWLSAAGFQVNEAADAESALALLAVKAVSVATIDKDMPGHPGTWLIEQIQEQYPGVAMLLSTGDGAIPANISLSRGVHAYLVKPLEREILVKAVTEAAAWAENASNHTQGRASEPDPVDAWLNTPRAGRQSKEE